MMVSDPAPEAPAQVQVSSREPTHPQLAQPALHRATLLIVGIVGLIVVGVAVLIVNIQYFGIQLAQEGGFDSSVAEIFFIRGLLSPFAHVMFTSVTRLFIGLVPAGRRRSLSWAKAHGQGALMRRYIRHVTRLAFTRNRIVTQRDPGRVSAQHDEAALLGTITEERRRLSEALVSAPSRRPRSTI